MSYMDNLVIVQGLYQDRKIHNDVLNLGPRKAADLPYEEGLPSMLDPLFPSDGSHLKL